MFQLIKIQLEIFAPPASAVSYFENWHFLSHRPPIFHKKLIKIQLEIFASLQMLWPPLEAPGKNFGPLQTLFPSLKIVIFCRIVPLFLRPCKSCFLLWKLSFSVASSPYYLPMFSTNYAQTACSPLTMRRPYDFPITEKIVPCKRCFLFWKSPFSDASPPSSAARNSLWPHYNH